MEALVASDPGNMPVAARPRDRLRADRRHAVGGGATRGGADGNTAGASPSLRKLTASNPGNTAWQRDLWLGHVRLGDALGRRASAQHALAEYRKSLAIAQKLAAIDPRNTDWQRELAISYSKIGDMLLAAERHEEALTEYRRSHVIREQLAAADPGNTQWQRDLSVNHSRIGDVLRAADRREDALAEYRRALAIRREARRQRSRQYRIGSATVGLSREQDWRRADDRWKRSRRGAGGISARALSLQRSSQPPIPAIPSGSATSRLATTGLATILAGRRDRARTRWRHITLSLAVVEKLVATDPDNTEWQTDLVIQPVLDQ